jgi:hypothetical protein
MCTSEVSFTFLAETNEYGAAAHGCVLLSIKIFFSAITGWGAGRVVVEIDGADDPQTA